MRRRLNANRGNLIEDGSCSPAFVADPLLDDSDETLGYLPLRDGSPALDAGDPRYCPEADQRGAARPAGAVCDLGAIESADAVPAAAADPTICTLFDQILAANTDTAVGACPAGRGADSITMVRDYTIATQGLPPITSEMTIDGNGHSISGDDIFGIFEVDGGVLTLKNVTLTKGNASLGGAIRLHSGGRASVSNVTFSQNVAGSGGAIATTSRDVRLSVSHSSFLDNRAETRGGAVFTDGGVIEIEGSSFLNNVAAQTGGALEALRGRVGVSNSAFNGNQAHYGGGIHVSGAEATLTDLTLTNNVAERINGAGIYGESGLVYLRNSIIAGSGHGKDCHGRLDQSIGNVSQDGTCVSGAGRRSRVRRIGRIGRAAAGLFAR